MVLSNTALSAAPQDSTVLKNAGIKQTVAQFASQLDASTI